MSILGGSEKTPKKPSNQELYPKDLPFQISTNPYSVNVKDKPLYERATFNLHPDLVIDINNHVNNQKNQGRKEWDPIVGKFKKINVSMWARGVFEEALKREGYVRPEVANSVQQQVQQQVQQEQPSNDKTNEENK